MTSTLEKTALADIQRQFVADPPRSNIQLPCRDLLDGRIEECQAYQLQPGSDDRGDLFELLTTRDGAIEPIVHVYQVWAEPGSIRAWVLHDRQTDRLFFTGGSFQVVLYDLRPESRTAGAIASIFVGASAPIRLTIAPLVAHGVRNIGTERAAFVNSPTRVYRHDYPDKRRLPFDSELIPFRW
jgi:dTDP-4-dehydrorhamnose 3,5-epimerase